jgi:hypothetical protein
MSKLVTGNTDFTKTPKTPLAQQQQMEKLIEMLKNSTAVQCDDCGCTNFIEVLKIRKVSGLISGLGREMIIPVPVHACGDCGHVNKFFEQNTGIPMEGESAPVDTPTGE